MIKPSLFISHSSGKYPIFIGNHILETPNLLQSFIQTNKVFIITDETIADHYLAKLKSTLSEYNHDTIVLPAGESQKNLQTFAYLIDQLISQNHHRDTTIIALGGGVVGDLAGFTAACYLRGVNFIQIPTTLLAQVDSSIGGKTAVNHSSGKNLIGAFYHPNAVIIDTETLKTLPDREFRSGLSEIIKAALIFDADFFDWIEHHQNDLLQQEPASLHYAIQRACEIKAHFVAADEKEHHQRMHLNFGHTFAHAIEHALDFKDWLHGEAVAYGMVLAAKLSYQHGSLPQEAYQRIERLLKELKLIKILPDYCTVERLTNTMMRDKKIRRDKLQLILLSNIGTSIITDQITQSMVQSAWKIQ